MQFALQRAMMTAGQTFQRRQYFRLDIAYVYRFHTSIIMLSVIDTTQRCLLTLVL